mgnify:CR=1 FL=1
MDKLSKETFIEGIAYIKSLEPLVIALFLCGILFLGWLLGKGTAKTKKSFKRLTKRGAETKELLD